MELNELIDTADGFVFSTKNRKKTGDTFEIYLFIEYIIYHKAMSLWGKS